MIENEKKTKNELTFQGVTSDETETFTGVDNDSFGNDCRDHDQDAWNWKSNEDFLMHGADNFGE